MPQTYILTQGLLFPFHEHVLRQGHLLSTLFYLPLFASNTWTVTFKDIVWFLLYCLCTMIWSGFSWPSAFSSFHHLDMCCRAYEIQYFVRNTVFCHLSRLHCIVWVLVSLLFDFPCNLD